MILILFITGIIIFEEREIFENFNFRKKNLKKV